MHGAGRRGCRAIGRGAPCLGEDNAYVFGEVLGHSETELAALAAEGVI